MDPLPLLNPLPSNAYYSSEQDCQDQLSVHANHQGFHSNATAEQMRRDDTLAQGHSTDYTVGDNHGTQYMTDRPVAAENQNRFSTNPANFIVGDSSGTISSATTPGSVGSSLTHPFTSQYQLHHSHPFYLSQPFGARNTEDSGHSYSGWRGDSTILHSGNSSALPREQYVYPVGTSTLGPAHIAYASSSSTYPTTSRSGEATLYQSASTTSSTGYDREMPTTNPQEQSHLFPFLDVEVDHHIQTANGDTVKPTIHAIATKGFFTAQGHWTCYRRNYFGLNAWYDLGLMVHNTPLFLDGKQIKAFAMHLSASIDGQEGKVVELVQYTPKRDLGEKTAIATTKLAPSQPTCQTGMSTTGTYINMGTYPPLGFPFLPLQNERDPESPESPSSAGQASSSSTRSHFSTSAGQGAVDATRHAFDRVQFKGATQNNGKRRASQQFYVLIVELLADIRSEDATGPEWKRVAYRPSDKLVVRGRSPSHYKDSDGRSNGHTGRGGDRDPYNAHGQHGSPGGGHGGPSNYSTGTGNAGAFRPSYSFSGQSSMSPPSSYSATSPSTNSDTITDVKHQLEPSLTREQLAHIQNFHTYRYFPETIYDGNPVQAKTESPASVAPPGVTSLKRDEGKIAIAEDYPNAIPGRHWVHGSYTGYLGTETSRGWYADLNSGTMY